MSVDLSALRHPTLGVPIAVYEYVRISGDLEFVNCRFEPKDFRAAHPTENGRWAWNLNGAQPLLYRLPRVETALANGELIYIVDGEKDADVIDAHGYAATCCARAQGWSLDLAEQLIGARRVRIVADNDGGPGMRQALEVRELLLQVTGLGSVDIEIVRAKAGKDAADHFAEGFGLDDFILVEDEEVAGEQAATVVDLLDDFVERDLPPAHSLVGVTRDGTNLLPRAGWVMPWGPAGSGKTSILIDLLFHACAGIDWLGYHVAAPLKVVVVINEGEPGALQDKLKQKLERWPHDTEAVRRNLAIYVSPWGEFSFRDEQRVRELRGFAESHEADYVAFDPLHTIANVTAGAPDETEAFKHVLREFGVWNDLGVITTHHQNKARLISGDWDRHPDTVFRLEKDGREPRTKLTLQKARPADPAELHVPVLLDWVVETLSYERRAMELTLAIDVDAVLSKVRERLAGRLEPYNMKDLLEGITGADDAKKQVVLDAIESGEIVNLAPSRPDAKRATYRLVANNGGGGEPLSLLEDSDEAQSGMVDPENNSAPLLADSGEPLAGEKQELTASLPEREQPLAALVEPDDDDDDIPDLKGSL